MKKIFAAIIILSSYQDVAAQNVGIGTTAPGFPLNFSNALGDKISLYGNNGNHYGFGIQGGLLQVHSDAAAANIAFGYGSSSTFTERMRIINSGGDGLSLGGRITLRNGTMPVDPNYGSGIWLYNADNTSMLGFMGVQNNQNIGFYGGPLNNGWGFTYDAINSRVGIGTSTPTASLMLATNMNPQLHIRQTNTTDYARVRMQTGTNRYWDIAGYNDATSIANERLNFFNSQSGDILSITGNGYVGIGNLNPNAPLAFAPSLGKKITLYPGATGDVGFGVQGNLLQLYADNPNADIAFGYDQGGVFTERMRIKGDGSIGIGTPATGVSVLLDLSSTTKGFLPPRMTSAQRDALAPVEGLMIYNTTSKKPTFYNGTEWKNFDGSFEYAAGNNYQGGKIAYMLQPGDPGYDPNVPHGLIAAAADLGTGTDWGCAFTAIPGADGTALGTGNQNTIDIMAGCGSAGIAARLCGDLVLNGYSDWYLPSKDELNKLYTNHQAIGGFASEGYWSSSESSTSYAWAQFWQSGGYQNTVVKYSSVYRVRPIRAF